MGYYNRLFPDGRDECRGIIYLYDPNYAYTKHICARIHHLFKTDRENVANRILTVFNICRKYRCPLMELKGACSHLSCLFSHNRSDQTLLSLPHYLCCVHLFNQMKIDLPYDEFTCRGLHTDLTELDDLERLKRKHSEYIEKHEAQKRLDEFCEICHRRVHRFGNYGFRQLAMLYCCDHQFCSKCLEDRRQAGKYNVCPVCKGVSKFIFNPWNVAMRNADHLYNDVTSSQ